MRVILKIWCKASLPHVVDDAVIQATTRQSVQNKLRILEEFCNKSGKIINRAKTKFMTINGKKEDHQELQSNYLVIENCQKYTYLGAVITQDGNIASSVRAYNSKPSERISSNSKPTSGELLKCPLQPRRESLTQLWCRPFCTSARPGCHLQHVAPLHRCMQHVWRPPGSAQVSV